MKELFLFDYLLNYKNIVIVPCKQINILKLQVTLFNLWYLKMAIALNSAKITLLNVDFNIIVHAKHK